MRIEAVPSLGCACWSRAPGRVTLACVVVIRRLVPLLVLGLGCGPSTGDGDGGGSGEASSANDGVSAPATTDSATGDATTTGGADTSGDTAADVTTGPDVPQACLDRDWDDHYASFQQHVAAANGRYWYTSRRYVYATGFTPDCVYTTTIEVDAGVVVRRILGEPEPVRGGDPTACTDAAFDEMGAEVGTHDAPSAGPAWTGDQVYVACCEDILAIEPAENYDIEYYANEEGLLLECYALEQNCADGCDFGPDEFDANSVDEWGFGPLPKQ
jgi:hypothetical protein